MPRRPPLTGTGAVCFRKQHRVEHLHASSFFHGCYSLWQIPRRGIPRSDGLSILGPRVERLGPLASRGTTRPRTRGSKDPRTRRSRRDTLPGLPEGRQPGEGTVGVCSMRRTGWEPVATDCQRCVSTGTGTAARCKKETQGERNPRKIPSPRFRHRFCRLLASPSWSGGHSAGPGDRCGVTGQGPGGKPWRRGGELQTNPSRKETCLTVPLKAVIGISSSFGLSSGFSQLLSLCWAQGCGVQGAEIREMSISFLSDIDFPVR